jgi:hypothetical protein
MNGAPAAATLRRALAMSLPLVHDRKALDAESLGDEFFFGRHVVHEDDVGIAAARAVQRLAGALRDHAHVDAAGGLEGRQQMREQPRLFGAGGRRHDDELVLRRRGQRRQQQRERSDDQTDHGFSPLTNCAAGSGSDW